VNIKTASVIYKENNQNEINYIRIITTDEKYMSIPADNACVQYQEYLAWLAEGNEPLPPDEPEQSEEPNA